MVWYPFHNESVFLFIDVWVSRWTVKAIQQFCISTVRKITLFLSCSLKIKELQLQKKLSLNIIIYNSLNPEPSLNWMVRIQLHLQLKSKIRLMESVAKFQGAIGQKTASGGQIKKLRFHFNNDICFPERINNIFFQRSWYN